MTDKITKKMEVIDLITDNCDHCSDTVVIKYDDSIYYVQTTDFEYRLDMGCLVCDEKGEEFSSYLDSEYIEALDELRADLINFAEDYLEKRFIEEDEEDEEGYVIFKDNVGSDHRRLMINRNYTNSHQSSYERRFFI